MIVGGKLAELNDGSIGLTMFWRNNPDGNYQADQVFFCRSTDGGKSWSRNAVDPTEWERNESTWVQFADGELLCVMRSNYNTHLGVSRSTDLGKTWTRQQPKLPFYGASAPSLLLTRDQVLLLSCRGWGIFTSIDRGHTWNLPMQIGSYTGGGAEAVMHELPDGTILVGGPEQPDSMANVTVDREGTIHPCP